AVHLIRGRSLVPVREMKYSVPSTLGQVLLVAALLLNQALLCVDAIVRTLVRLFVTRRRLLEWETAASAERRLGIGLKDFWRNMWPTTLAAVGLGVVVVLVRPEILPAACLFLIPWLLSPLLAYWISQPPTIQAKPLTPAESRELRSIARKTWAFFERFVGAEDHWLPPDNFQEEPQAGVAHRTSPTNMGMYLLSSLAAHDLGYLGLSALTDRLEKTFDTFDRLERFRGHFLNWYDTLTLRPLPPAYVSTVDSGNQMGCLLTLQQGLLEKLRAPVLGPALCTGLADTLGLVHKALRDIHLPRRGEASRLSCELADLVDSLGGQFQLLPSDLPAWAKWLERLEAQAATLLAQSRHLAESTAGAAEEAAFWAERFSEQVQGLRAEIKELVPWAGLLTAPGADDSRRALADLGEKVERWEALAKALAAIPVLKDYEEVKKNLLEELDAVRSAACRRLDVKPPAGGTTNGEQAVTWLAAVRQAVADGAAAEVAKRVRQLGTRAEALASAMDFRFLYNADRNLFAVGYQVPLERLDPACYDLLASEARLASFLAIARGDAPRRHWFHLGRSLTRAGGRLCLLSWGGTMFEYLMPNLLMRLYPGTLLAESSDAAVILQERYGRQRGVPWGVSESAFSSQHVSFDYQYQAFGVPGLGLKRGLGQDLVIAPYATALAVTVRPHDALQNLRRLAAEGAAGRYGFYESVDYTRNRLPEGRRSLVVRCFMAHHQGMSLVALANGLLGDVMPRRFHAAQLVRSTELLLEERLPRTAEPVVPPDMATVGRPTGQEGPSPVSRRITTPFTPGPRTHLLSNGHYSVMVTNAGSGFSRCDDLDVTRWREDFTRDDPGNFCYIRDL
ncbi:MAG TPA: glucoamylase family protein, partial [Gemmataceae bacterium]|nr:glucoamylase family protein [Gemmataceae bacterium]